MNTLDEWTAQVARDLGVDDALDQQAALKAVLDVARDVAHGVARPAAPVTTFLIGLAATRADDPVAALPQLAERVTTLAAAWAEGANRAEGQ